MTAAIVVAVLVTGAVYLVLQRELLRTVLGFILLGHGVNILIISAGGLYHREPPLLGQQDRAQMADPLPQAFVLTAIVIAFAVTVYLLALLKAGVENDDGTRPDPDRTPVPEIAPGAGGEHADDTDPAGGTGGALNPETNR